MVTSLLFVDDLGFIVSGTSVEEIAQILEMVETTVLELDVRNAIRYDTPKLKAILFFKSYRQQLSK